MALGKNCRSKPKRVGVKTSRVDVTEKKLQVVRPMKRVISNCTEADDSTFQTPLKKQSCTRLNIEESPIEALPQDLLIKVLCGVEHKDLKQLFHVSNKIREAALIAKEWHFAFSTPSTKNAPLKLISELEETSNKFDMDEAPNAPRQQRATYRSRICDKKLASITIALFRSTEEDRPWSKGSGLLLETVG